MHKILNYIQKYVSSENEKTLTPKLEQRNNSKVF